MPKLTSPPLFFVVLATLSAASLAETPSEIVARAPMGVTAAAERLLANSAEPRRLQLMAGDDLFKLARRSCGRLTPTYFGLLLNANKGGTGKAGSTVIIPACFVTRIDKAVPVVPGETWSDLAERSVGVAGSKTLRGILSGYIDGPIPNGVWSAAAERIPVSFSYVKVPTSTEPIAYRIREGFVAAHLAAQLQTELNTTAVTPGAMSPSTDMHLEAGVDPALIANAICPTGPLTQAAAWPFSVTDVAAVMQRNETRFAQLGGAPNTTGVVAVIDNGVDGIFSNAFPENEFVISVLERAKPNDGVDQDGNGYADDVVGTNIYDGGEPVAFAAASTPAHGTMMTSLVLGGTDYRSWLKQSGSMRHVKVRPVSIVRHSVEPSAQGNLNKYAMPTDSLGKAIDYAARDGATILNLSVSTPVQLPAVEDALYNRSNLLLVVAAGNSATNLDRQSLYPAALSNMDTAYRGRVITVAAHNRQGCLSGFSGRGRETVDIAAPGEAIVATGLNGVEASGEGTSQATALVSFIAAQLRSIGLDQARSIKERLVASVDLDHAFVGYVRSEGKLNPGKALSIYDDVLELSTASNRLSGHLPSLLTVNSICPSMVADDRKVLKVSRRIDGGDTTQTRLLVRNSDDRGRLEVVHCAPSATTISFQGTDGVTTSFQWQSVVDLVPAV